jgi:hypothetical protein
MWEGPYLCIIMICMQGSIGSTHEIYELRL